MKTEVLLRHAIRISIVLVLLILENNVEAQVCGVNAGISKTICMTEPLILSGKIGNLEATPSNRLWTQLSGPLAQIENPLLLRSNVNNLNPGNYVFQLEAKCIDGLTAKDLVYITVLPEPATPLVGDDSIVCFNDPIQLSANAVTEPNAGTWTVMPKVGSFYPNANAPNAIYTDSSKTPGIKKFTWTISNGNCSKSAVKQITFSEPTIPVYAGNDTTLFCKGKCMFLKASFPGSGSMQSGMWKVVSGPNSPAFANATKANSKLCNLIPGVYVLRWTVSGVCLNQSSDVIITVLNINEPPVSIGNRSYSEYCETPIVTSQLIEGAPKSPGDSVIWEQLSGGTTATISPDINQSRITIGNLTGRFPYKFNYTQISEAGCSITKVHTVYRAQPLTGLTQPLDLLLPCNITDTIIEISYDRPNIGTESILRKATFVSGPIDTGKIEFAKTIFTASTAKDIWTAKGLGAQGEYIYKFEYENSCGVNYRAVKITVSVTPGVLNPGSDLYLPCRELVVSPVGSVDFPGEFIWSQVSGPTTATLTGESSLSPVIEGLSHGVYRFRLTNYGGLACSARSRDMKIVVTQSPPLNATTGPDAAICAGSYRLAGNFPGTTESGEWTVSPATGVQFLPNVNTANAIVSGLSPNTIYTFTWKIKNACGSVSASQILTTGSFYSAPVADAGEDICLPFGTPGFILHGNSADNSLPVWTSLSQGVILSAPNSSVTEAVFNSSGTYMFEYSLGSVGCDAIKDTIVISVRSNTVVNAGEDIKICSEADSQMITLNAVLQGEDFAGEWRQISGAANANILSPNINTTEVILTGEGSYLFEYAINFGNSCSATSDSILVTINRAPSIANAGEDQSLCNADISSRINITGSLVEFGQGSWEILSSPWGNGGSVISNLSSRTAYLSNLFQGTYRLRYTVRNGEICVASTDDINIDVNVKADAGTNINECGASLLTLSGNPNTAGAWSLVSDQQGVIISSTSGNTSIVSGVVPSLSSSYIFRYSLPEQGSCPSTFSEFVYNNFPLPSRAVTQGNVSLCSDISTVLLSGNVPQSGEGKWTLISGPNNPVAGLMNNSSNDTLLKNLIPGLYEYSYEIITHPACSTSKENVLIMKEISAKTRSNFRVCETKTVSLNGNVPFLGIGSWSYVSGTSSVDSVIFSDANNPFSSASGLTYGNHIFKWEIPGILNCPSTSNNLEIIIDSTLTQLSAGADTSFCQKEGTVFYLGAEEIAGVTYTWTPETLLGNASVAKPAFYGGNNSGNYIYTLKGKRGSCETYASIHLNILPKPFANININYGSCAAQFSASAPGRGITNPIFNWNLGVSTLSSGLGSGPFQINFNSSLPQHLFLQVVSQDGCISKDTLNFSPFCIVPLKFTSFEGKWHNDFSRLNWVIQQPDSYKKYEVQRSFTGVNFSTIGIVNGFSNIGNYKFDDIDDELKYAGVIYYRLKTIDFNNEFYYSEIVLLKNTTAVNIKSGPNPFTDKILVKFNKIQIQEKILIKIYTSTGKLVKSKSFIMMPGESEIVLNDLSNLSAGTYILKIISNEESVSQKIIKLL